MWLGTWPASPGAATRLPTGTSTTTRNRMARKMPVRWSIRLLGHLRPPPPGRAAGRGRAGFFWMNRMMKTRIRIFAEHRAREGLEELVGDAEREGGGEGAPEVAGAAEHHDEERVDDVGLPEVRRDVVDLAERDAGEPGDAGAEAEGQGVDPGGADAHLGGHRPVLGDGAHLQAEAACASSRSSSPAKTASAKRMMYEAVPGDEHLADLERARHPRRVADLAVGRAEDRADRLLQDQADAPGGEQRLERPAVEVADDAALDGDADRRRRPGRRAGWR